MDYMSILCDVRSEQAMEQAKQDLANAKTEDEKKDAEERIKKEQRYQNEQFWLDCQDAMWR